MKNWQKWLSMIGFGFFGGALGAASDPDVKLRDYIRHGLMGVVPAVTALNVNLQKETDDGQ